MRIVFLLLLCLPGICKATAQDLAIVDAKVYPSPEAQAVNHATIVIHDGKITAVGEHVVIPHGVVTLPCTGCVVLAGFWNTHVHFTEAKWIDAEHQPADRLTQNLQQMLTLSGFTTVVDTASDPTNTIALRRRIESGEVAGPHIYTAGAGLYPPHAIPFYLKDLPPEILAHLPQPEDPAAARAVVEENISLGTDIVKLFTGSIVAPGHIVPMPLAIATAAGAAGHEHGQLVFAHPSNLAGTRVAMESGVDVLAHSPESHGHDSDSQTLFRRFGYRWDTIGRLQVSSVWRAAYVRHRHRISDRLQRDGGVSAACAGWPDFS
jgi:imidazolonepropionase-like amidohydrolase